MTIKRNSRQREQRSIRRWAKKHLEEIYRKLGQQCYDCGTRESLTIHHKQYKIGYEFVEILCDKCHKKFHRFETQKRMLTIFLSDIEEFEGDIEKYKDNLRERIEEIKVDLIEGLIIDGLTSWD